MEHMVEGKIDFIKELHKNSNYAILIFDEDRKVIYNNKVFNKIFNINNKNDIDTFFSEFIIEDDKKRESLRKFSLKNLLKDSQSFATLNANDYSYYKIAVSALGKLDRKSIYYASIFELYTIKEKFLERSMNALVNASLLKDNETGNHVKRINEYSYVLTYYLYKTRHETFHEINDYFIQEISKAASLHDVGKIGTPDYILTKPAKLTDQEFEIIKEHTINGALILSSFASDMARDIALFHHEKWDGTGYPYNLFQDQIPLSARIVSVADVYDALRMKRYYKEAFSHEESRKIILGGKNKHFQGEIIEAFEEIEEKFNEIFNTLTDEGGICK